MSRFKMLFGSGAAIGLFVLGFWSAQPVAVAQPVPHRGEPTCADLTALESAAIQGDLGPGRIACLDARMVGATLNDQLTISHLLMSDAFSAGDTAGWERRTRHHLTVLDPNDPDLNFKMAVHLSKKGTPAAMAQVLTFADVALAGRTRWTGNTYTQRVVNLYKFKAAAAHGLWIAAQGDPMKEPAARALAEVTAREWLEYAKVSGKQVSTALALCATVAAVPSTCGT